MVKSERRAINASALSWLRGGIVCFSFSCSLVWRSVVDEEPLMPLEVAGILSFLAIAPIVNGMRLLKSKGNWYAATSRAFVIVQGGKARSIGWQDFDHAQFVASAVEDKVKLAYRNKMKHRMGETIVLPQGTIDPQTIARICNEHIQRYSKKEKAIVVLSACSTLRPSPRIDN